MLVSYTITPCNFVVTKSQRLTAFWLKALLSRSSRKLLEPDWGNRWPSWPRATYSNQVLITSSCAANSPRNCQPFDRPFLRRSGHGAAPALHAVQRHAWVDLGAKTASSEGRYSPSMVRRAVSADTGFVQISTLTQVISIWLGMWLEANMIHDLRHSDARERAKYGFAQGIEGLPSLYSR